MSEFKFLWLGLFFVFVFALWGSFDSGDVDTSPDGVLGGLCVENNSFLKLVNGVFVCDSLDFAEGFYDNYSNPLLVEINSTGVWYNFSGFLMGNSSGFVWVGNGVVVNKSAWYHFGGSVSFSDSNGDFDFNMFEGDEELLGCGTSRSTSGSIGNVGFTCIVFLHEGDFLTFRVKDYDVPSNDVIVYNMNINIFEIV